MSGVYPKIYLTQAYSEINNQQAPFYPGVSLRFLYRAFGVRPAFAEDAKSDAKGSESVGGKQQGQNFKQIITDLILISNEDEQRVVAIMPPNYAVVSIKFSGHNHRKGSIFGNHEKKRKAKDLKAPRNKSLQFCVYVPILPAPNVSILFCKMLGNSFCDWLLVKMKESKNAKGSAAYHQDNKKIFTSLTINYEDLLSKTKIVVDFRWGLKMCAVKSFLKEGEVTGSKQLAITELDEYLLDIFTVHKIGLPNRDGKFFRKSTRFNMTLERDSEVRLFDSIRYDDAMQLIKLMPYLDQFETIERSSSATAMNSMLTCYQGVKLSQIEQRLECLKTRVLKMVKSSTLQDNFKYYLIWTVSLAYFREKFISLTEKPAVILICCDDQKKNEKMTNKDWKNLSHFLEQSRTAIVVLDVNFESITAVKMILEEFARCFGLKFNCQY